MSKSKKVILQVYSFERCVLVNPRTGAVLHHCTLIDCVEAIKAHGNVLINAQEALERVIFLMSEAK